MTVSSATSGLIKPGTTVTDATTTTVTFSPPLQGTLTAGEAVTFTFPLSSGIVQDNTIDVSLHFFGVSFVIVPMAVATAIVPLNFYVAAAIFRYKDPRNSGLANPSAGQHVLQRLL